MLLFNQLNQLKNIKFDDEIWTLDWTNDNSPSIYKYTNFNLGVFYNNGECYNDKIIFTKDTDFGYKRRFTIGIKECKMLFYGMMHINTTQHFYDDWELIKSAPVFLYVDLAPSYEKYEKYKNAIGNSVEINVTDFKNIHTIGVKVYDQCTSEINIYLDNKLHSTHAVNCNQIISSLDIVIKNSKCQITIDGNIRKITVFGSYSTYCL